MTALKECFREKVFNGKKEPVSGFLILLISNPEQYWQRLHLLTTPLSSMLAL